MIRVVKTDKAPKPVGPYSQALIAGDFIFVAGQVGVNPATGEVPKSVANQTRQALENIKAILETAGTSMDNVVKTTVFLVDITTFNEMNKTYEAYFKGNPPARSAIQAKLALDTLKIEIDAIAYIGK